MKKIIICGKEHEIKCNALVHSKYRLFFNRSIFDDIKILQEFLINQTIEVKKIKDKNPSIDDAVLISSLSKVLLNDAGIFIEAALRIAYVMCYMANKSIPEFEEWLEDIPSVKTNDEWIVEVTEYAVTCFCW